MRERALAGENVEALAGLKGRLSRMELSPDFDLTRGIEDARRLLKTLLSSAVSVDAAHAEKVLAQSLPSLSPDDNQCLIAFWTCFQITRYVVTLLYASHDVHLLNIPSDINIWSALHQSSSLNADCLPYPDGKAWEAAWKQREPEAGERPALVIESFLVQSYITKHLNNIHHGLRRDINLSTLFQGITDAQSDFPSMNWVPERFRFEEDEPPAANILIAWFRMRYWEVQDRIYRPCIKFTIFGFIGRRYTEAPEAEAKVLDYAKNGIRALVESMRAVHNFDKLYPTNVLSIANK